MPHIVADREVTAWYALGYEQARDELLFIQVACKGAKGELTWALGSKGLVSDIAVKVFNSHGRIAAMTVPQRRGFFASTNPAVLPNNFYDNCEAYAAGVDAYRLAVQLAPATPLTPERSLKNWLDNNNLPGVPNNLAWVYQDQISAVDIAAQGAWIAAFVSLRWPSSSALVNMLGGTNYYSLLPGADTSGAVESDPSADPLAPDNLDRLLDGLRQQMSSLPGAASAFAGSNTFAWSGHYCKVGTTRTYPGLLGDPHQAIPAYDPSFATAFQQHPNHLWVAHVKVTQPGATAPSLDVIGHVPHGAAAFFTGHNRSVAMGGTLGGPNHCDRFLLRLEEMPNGTVDPGRRYYSYYHDSSSNPTNTSFRALSLRSITLRLPGPNSTANLPYWQADSFGVILPEFADVMAFLAGGPLPPFPTVFGERDNPNLPAPRWRVSIDGRNPQARMRFWKDRQLDGAGNPTTHPMVVALRAPIDDDVSGEDKHWHLIRDFWEINHAASVFDVIDKTNGGAYLANLCFVDRKGRTFTTQASAIPERGNDQQLSQAGHYSADKAAIYAFGSHVPARFFADKMYDWQFGSHANPVNPAGLRYLQYPTRPSANQVPNPLSGTILPFKPMVLQDPDTFTAFPPIPTPWPPPSGPSGPFTIESGLFAAACNDQIWGFSRKRENAVFQRNPLLPHPNFPQFNDVTVMGNTLLQWVLNAGVAYQTAALDLEAPDRQQIVIEKFTRQAERLIHGASFGEQAQTPNDMREFAVSPQLYREPSYKDPTTHQPNATLSALPAPIRQLKEVSTYPIANGTPLLAAEREVRFFNDLWTTLHSTLWDQYGVQGSQPALSLNLRDLWLNIPGASVGGHRNQVFWYGNPSDTTTLRWIDLPESFPLIDFYWPATQVSRKPQAVPALQWTTWTSAWDVRTYGALPDQNSFDTLVNQLVTWDSAADYKEVPGSTAACFLEMMRLGYNARGSTYGRHWLRMKDASVQYTPGVWTPLNATGQLPSLSSAPVLENAEWAALRDIAFPGPQLATLFRPVPGVLVPYDALYFPGTTTVRPKQNLGAPEINALVNFFLGLGNHLINAAHNDGSPSTKMARYTRIVQSFPTTPTQADIDSAFVASLPARYPLTEGLQRLTAVRAVLDTKDFFDQIAPTGTPPFSQCFRTRAYGHTGQVWPPRPNPTPTDNPCYGGALRAVNWNEEPGAIGHTPFRGFQPKFIGVGGSIATLLAMFPHDTDNPTAPPKVDSYFWCTPGVEVMSFDPTRFDAHMNAFATNQLLETRYEDFLNPTYIRGIVIHEY